MILLLLRADKEDIMEKVEDLDDCPDGVLYFMLAAVVLVLSAIWPVMVLGKIPKMVLEFKIRVNS